MKLKTKDIGFVVIQFCLFIIYLFDSDFLNFDVLHFIRIIGISIAILGGFLILIATIQLNTSLSPFPSPKSGANLIQNGVYRYIRHPIYTAILLITFGYGIYIGSLFKILVTIVLYVLFYFKSVYEEERLVKMFLQYTSYKKRTGRFLPKWLN
ncbi:methyltransferase family protein [Aquimarina algiphila]|uniref:methyltransferase family protein n=1 Tax=Aquimarina algiphila TaxID=2047982 RepID=UPI002330E827|nr:isoprenylcysteine carboxylmethyltransferase family protein [Aquimarina algiphila]